MRTVVSMALICLCTSFTFTGCTGEFKSSVDDNSSALSATEALYGMVAITGIVYARQAQVHQEQANRPKVVLSGSRQAAVNQPVTVEAVYRLRGNLVSAWWEQNPYTVTIRSLNDDAELKPESEKQQADGRLSITFKAGDSGDYVVEVRTWAAGADTARVKPKAAAKCMIKVR